MRLRIALCEVRAALGQIQARCDVLACVAQGRLETAEWAIETAMGMIGDEPDSNPSINQPEGK
jgi:hypothetical protein